MDDVCNQLNRAFRPSVAMVQEYGVTTWAEGHGLSLNSILSRSLEDPVAEILKGAEFKDREVFYCWEPDFYG